MTDSPPSQFSPVADDAPSPVADWSDFIRWFRATWEQGQHVTMIGTTGSGKTTLAKQILSVRSYVVAFGVKGRDDTMEDFIRAGYWRMREWNGDLTDYAVLWPEIKGAGHTDHQRDVFARAIDSIFRAGGWCVFFDEVVYLSETLGLEKALKFLLNQGRSSGISVVAATQRPAFIPLAFYDQPTHLFIWKDNDRRNLKRLGELAGNAMPIVTSEIASLQRREVLYFNKDTGVRVRTTVRI